MLANRSGLSDLLAEEIPTVHMNSTAAPIPAKTSRRVRIALLMSVIIFTAIFVGSWVWALFIAFFLVVAFREMTAMMLMMDIKPSQFIVLTSGALMILAAAANKPEFLSPILTLTVVGSFFRLLFRNPVGSMADIGGTLLSVVYIAYLPVYFILLRELPMAPPVSVGEWGGVIAPTATFFQSEPGLTYLLLVVLVVSLSDIGAYYCGMKFGKSLLYPEVSPKKTREGALGGVFAGFLSGMFFSWLSGFPIQHAMFLSVMLTIVGQIGDLIESAFKRNAGIKDSGGLLQGHGGLLDRMDSYIFSGVLAYYYIYWIILDQGLARDVRQLFQNLLG